MIYKVRHVTRISYAAPVSLARFNVRLRPAAWPGQVLLDYDLTLDPQPWTVQDEPGPWVVNRTRLLILKPLTALRITSAFRVAVDEPGCDPVLAASPTVAEIRALALADHDLSAMGPAGYLFASPLAQQSATIARWAAPHLADSRSVIDAGMALMEAIHREFVYDDGATEADTTPEQAFAQKRGVCQDFGHVMIVAARSCGIPAAYVSGYLRTLPPPGQPRLVGADATHAWVNLWCGPQLGWVGFDPTNACLARTDHIFTAMGRDYADVAPIDGVFRGSGGQSMAVAVDVAPEAE